MKSGLASDAVLLVLAAFIIYLTFPFLTGSEKIMVVLSGSMTPIMLPGDMIVIKSVDPEELKVGDVIAFQSPNGKPNTVFTHRIISISNSGELEFQTKGDANRVKDNLMVPAANVKGELVFVIPFLGYLPNMAKSKFVFLGTIILPIGILMLDELRKAARYRNPARAKKLEREQRKIEKKTRHVVKNIRLESVVFIGGILAAGLIVPGIGVKDTALNHENTINSQGLLPEVYIITPDNPEQQYTISPWYGVVSRGNETQVIAPENTPVRISLAPYVLPVFWLVALAKLNPYLPGIAEVGGYIAAFVLICSPVWYRKSIRGNYAKRSKRGTLTAKLRRIVWG